MANFNRAVISVGPSVQKVDVATTVCKILSTTSEPTEGNPAFSTLSIVDGEITWQEYLPQWVGQIIATKSPDLPSGTLYIAMRRSYDTGAEGPLQWKRVSLGYTVEDISTGDENDPFSELY
jgi:hypothetical protein